MSELAPFASDEGIGHSLSIAQRCLRGARARSQSPAEAGATGQATGSATDDLSHSRSASQKHLEMFHDHCTRLVEMPDFPV